MRSTLDKLSNQRSLPLMLPPIVISIQSIFWIVTFSITASMGESRYYFLKDFLDVLIPAWFFLSLLSVLGIYVGITYQRRHGFSWLAAAGVVLNVLWFLAFVLVIFMVFVFGITA